MSGGHYLWCTMGSEEGRGANQDDSVGKLGDTICGTPWIVRRGSEEGKCLQFTVDSDGKDSPVFNTREDG